MKCECTPCKKCGTFFDGEGLSNAIAVPDPYEMLCLECSAREPRPKTHTGGLSQEFLAGMFKYGSPSYESARRSCHRRLVAGRRFRPQRIGLLAFDRQRHPQM